MTEDEINAELLECARYGEDEDLLTLLQHGGKVNHNDDRGNTALHRAAANGHVACMKILKEHGADHIANSEGNYPIHWAAQNGQADALKFLFENYTVDVLEKNSQGRSTLTEAFASTKTEVIELALSHETAAEDRLLDSAAGNNQDSAAESSDSAAAMDTSKEDTTVTHIMNLLLQPLAGAEAPTSSFAGETIKIRELPITRADHPFGSEENPEDDTTGLGIWPAAVLLSRWVAALGLEEFKDKVVVELGAGCGLPAITSAVYGSPKTVYLTDIHEPTLENARHNANINTRNDSLPEASNFVRVSPVTGQETLIAVRNVNWKDHQTFPEEKADIILGSDLVYDMGILDMLIPAIQQMLSPSGVMYYVAPITGRAGMDELVQRLAAVNIECQQILAVPDEYYSNPLVEGNEDNYILYFYDLSAKQPHLFYKFAFKQQESS